MPTSWLRTLLVIATLVVAMGVVRSASAYAPFCDPRAATSLAPPPFTAIPDVRWEASPAFLQLWCDQLQAARNLDREPDLARDRFSPNRAEASSDLGAPRRTIQLPRRHAATRVPVHTVRANGPPGIRGRVYRPPR